MRRSIFVFSIVGSFTSAPDCFKIILLGHMAQISALALDTRMKKSYYRRKPPPTVIGGTQTQVFENTTNIAASAPQPIYLCNSQILRFAIDLNC